MRKVYAHALLLLLWLLFRLRQNMPVHAEEFESATVFFSDVSNFAEVSASSTPIATVAFLNSIYTFLDEVIEKFDAYKVPQKEKYICPVNRSMTSRCRWKLLVRCTWL